MENLHVVDLSDIIYEVMIEDESFAKLKYLNSISSGVVSDVADIIAPEDSIPFDDGVLEYCKEFMNTHFYGERKSTTSNNGSISSGVLPAMMGDLTKNSRRRNTRKISLTMNSKPYRKISEPNPVRTESDTLGTWLKIFHSVLTAQSSLSMNSCLSQYILLLAALRKREDEKIENCVARLMNDFEQFLNIYNRKAASTHTVNDQHWGSCQQLRCGKVITDFLDGGTSRTMDPVFGVLLCPYGGQIDREDDSDEIEAYHRVMFDAFKYLQTFHDIGPGADYLGSLTLLEPDSLEPEENCRLFWKRMMDRVVEEVIEVKKKMY